MHCLRQLPPLCYNDGTKEGVVFWVDETGKHGKIVSLAHATLPWCTEAQYDKKIAVGATSKTDGKANTDKVMARADSREYTAFVWCRNMGKSWYLPAIEELKLLLLDDAVYNAVNKTLESRGYIKIFYSVAISHWSSTESNKFGAWYADNQSGNYTKQRYVDCTVRAVAQF